MVPEIGRFPIGVLQACDMFYQPAPFMINTDLIDSLETQALFPDRYSHPQGALIIFKAIPAQPGGSPGELDSVQDHKYIRGKNFIKKSRKWSKIGLAGTEDYIFVSILFYKFYLSD